MPRGVRDANEPDIIRCLKSAGFEVKQLEDRDDDEILDLLVFGPGKMMMLEVKTAKGRLKDGQVRIINRWPQHCKVVRTVQEALEAMGAIVVPIQTMSRRVAQTR